MAELEVPSTPRSGFLNSPGFVILMGTLTAFDPLSIDMYLPAFKDIQRELSTTYSAVELSLSSFFIGMAIGQMVYGPLADRFGRKKPLLFGMALYMLSTLGCALSTNIAMLIAFRTLQAFGGCAGMVITRAIVRDLFDKKRSAHFFSSLMLVMGLAPILAPLVGGYVNEFLGWRAIFYLLAAMNFVSCMAITFLLPETLLKKNSQLTMRKVLAEYVDLLRTRNFIGYVIPDGAIRAGMFAYIAGSPFVFIELFHVPQARYGWIFGSNALGLIASSQVNRWLLSKYDSDRILGRILPFAALAGFTLFVLSATTASMWGVLVPLFFFIASLGFVGPNASAGALAPQGHRAGMASALYGTLQWSLASLSSFLVSELHNGTALPMTGLIFACGLTSATAFYAMIANARKASV